MSLFDPVYCNTLLDQMVVAFPQSVHASKHLELENSSPRLWSKKFIQLAQIRMAIDYVIQFPHLEDCFKRLSILQTPYLQEASFLNEMQSFFTSDYGEDDARNYAIALKQYIEFVRHTVEEFRRVNQEIFGTDVQRWKVPEVYTFVKLVQSKIKAFLKSKEELFVHVFHRFEVYVEKKRFQKLVTLLESK